MNPPRQYPPRQRGFSMIEVLVALIILLVGLLGLAGLMLQSQRSEFESYQRVQALILLRDMVGRINANRNVAACYAFTVGTGAPYLGTGSTLTPSCTAGTATQNAQAAADMRDWSTLLQGAAESAGGANTGAMVGARGCVSYDGTDLLLANNGTAIPGTGPYTVSVAWQGLGETYANTVQLCGQGLYGPETRRRVASLTFRIGSISNTN